MFRSDIARDMRSRQIPKPELTNETNFSRTETFMNDVNVQFCANRGSTRNSHPVSEKAAGALARN